MTAGPLLTFLPRGDGHAVLVLPGLGASDASTAPLRWFIDRLGYRSYGWGLGANRGFGRHVDDGLGELLATWRETGPVSLIGPVGRREPVVDVVDLEDGNGQPERRRRVAIISRRHVDRCSGAAVGSAR